MHKGWTQTDYQNKHYNINQKVEETQDDRGSDGGTNFIMRIWNRITRLTLQEHDDDDDDDDDATSSMYRVEDERSTFYLPKCTEVYNRNP